MDFGDQNIFTTVTGKLKVKDYYCQAILPYDSSGDSAELLFDDCETIISLDYSDLKIATARPVFPVTVVVTVLSYNLTIVKLFFPRLQ